MGDRANDYNSYLSASLANQGYGIQQHGRAVPSGPDRDVIEMAARIVAELRSGDPSDPLLLKARRVLSNYLGDA